MVLTSQLGQAQFNALNYSIFTINTLNFKKRIEK